MFKLLKLCNSEQPDGFKSFCLLLPKFATPSARNYNLSTCCRSGTWRLWSKSKGDSAPTLMPNIHVSSGTCDGRPASVERDTIPGSLLCSLCPLVCMRCCVQTGLASNTGHAPLAAALSDFPTYRKEGLRTRWHLTARWAHALIQVSNSPKNFANPCVCLDQNLSCSQTLDCALYLLHQVIDS